MSEASQGAYEVQSGLWTVPSLQMDGTATLSMTTRVEARTAGTAVVNSAAIVASDQPDSVPENNLSVVSVIVGELLAVYLPGVFKEYAPFPVYIGGAIPARSAQYPGEVFYTTVARLPDELPAGGRFYFSAQPQVVVESLVDDELVVRLDGRPVFTFDFSTSGRPIPARVQVPRTTMEQLAGEMIEVSYRDRYAVQVSASEMWMIWVP